VSWLAPFVGWSLYLKLLTVNAALSPGGAPLPEAQGVLAALVVLMVGAALWLPGRWRYAAWWALQAAVVTMVTADLWYERYFDDIWPVSALLHGSQALGVNHSLW